MKKTIFIFALMGLTFVSCKKEDKDPEPEQTPTPAVTYNLTTKMDGADFNCKDGKGDLYNGTLVLSGHDVNNSNTKGIVMYLILDSISVKTFPVGHSMTGPTAMAYYTDLSTNPTMEYRSEDSGLATDKITITKFDKTNKKISGTFNFTCIDDNGSSAQKVFTNGTFTDLTW